MIKKDKIKLYEVDETSEVFKISLVEDPAVDSMFVALSKQNKYINFESDEKRMVYGCALRPNFPIYRYDESGEYYLKFTQKSIETLARKFIINGYQSSWNVDHSKDVDGVVLVESWIKYDQDNDKSIAIGLDKDLPVGTWFVGAYIENDEVWNNIKEGKWGGFSIEALCDYSEITQFSKQNIDMEINESFWEKLKEVLKELLGKKEEISEDAEQIAEEVAEVAKEQVESEEVETEEMSAEDEAEVVKEEEVEQIADEVEAVVETETETEDEKAKELQAIIDSLQAKVDELQAKIETEETENEELRKQNEKLSKQPSASKIELSSSKQNGVTDAGRAFLDALYGGKLKY